MKNAIVAAILGLFVLAGTANAGPVRCVAQRAVAPVRAVVQAQPVRSTVRKVREVQPVRSVLRCLFCR